MAQATKIQDGIVLDYTPGSDVSIGDIAEKHGLLGVVTHDTDSGDLGAIAISGVYDVVQAGEIIADGADVYWDADGNPYGGTAGTGAATRTPNGNKYLGRALETTTANTAKCKVLLNGINQPELPQAIADPGDTGAIPVVTSGYCPIVTEGAETRTLAAPTFKGQELWLYLKTDGGDAVITVAHAINAAGNTTVTFADVTDTLFLRSVESGSSLVWRVVSSDGAALSTP